MTDLATCFDQFRESAFRLEALPSYVDPPHPALRSLRSSGYLRRIARSVLDGKTWTHVRVIDDPPTGYQRRQLRRDLVELHALGADVFVLERSALRVDLLDFWLFDRGRPGSRAVLMHYDGGVPLPDADEVVTDPGHLGDLDGIAGELVGLSVPLTDYLAAVDA